MAKATREETTVTTLVLNADETAVLRYLVQEADEAVVGDAVGLDEDDADAILSNVFEALTQDDDEPDFIDDND